MLRTFDSFSKPYMTHHCENQRFCHSSQAYEVHHGIKSNVILTSVETWPGMNTSADDANKAYMPVEFFSLSFTAALTISFSIPTSYFLNTMFNTSLVFTVEMLLPDSADQITRQSCIWSRKVRIGPQIFLFPNVLLSASTTQIPYSKATTKVLITNMPVSKKAKVYPPTSLYFTSLARFN